VPLFFITVYRLIAYLDITTTAVQDQIIRQNLNSRVFNAVYLNQKVRFNVQAVFLERLSLDRLTKVFTYISLTTDLCASINIPGEILKALPPDLNIVDLENDHKELKRLLRYSYKTVAKAEEKTSDWDVHQILVRQVNSAKKKHNKEIKKEYQ
jgi:hypothetical protein